MTPAQLEELKAAWPGDWKPYGHDSVCLKGPKFHVSASVWKELNGSTRAILHVDRPCTERVSSRTFKGAVKALKSRLQARAEADTLLLGYMGERDPAAVAAKKAAERIAGLVELVDDNREETRELVRTRNAFVKAVFDALGVSEGDITEEYVEDLAKKAVAEIEILKANPCRPRELLVEGKICEIVDLLEDLKSLFESQHGAQPAGETP